MLVSCSVVMEMPATGDSLQKVHNAVTQFTPRTHVSQLSVLITAYQEL